MAQSPETCMQGKDRNLCTEYNMMWRLCAQGIRVYYNLN